MRIKTIIMILIISIIFIFILSPDMADEDLMDNTITSNMSEKLNISDPNIKFVNGSYYYLPKNEGVVEMKSSDKIHTVKVKKTPQSKPTITITAKPSCGCRYSYRWRTNTFVNYCPHCGHYNVLKNVHKWQAKYEQELTCTKCGADYCGQCGKEKYSWSRYYLSKC